MSRAIALCLAAILLTGAAFAESAAKTFGKAPTLTESTAIAKLNAEPQTFVDKDVLLNGKVVNMCTHKGCWVEIENEDGARVICRSLDETILFPKESLGQKISLQGKVMFDPKAPGEVIMKHESEEMVEVAQTTMDEGKVEAKSEKTEKRGEEAPHACPAPKILVSISGATVEYGGQR